MHTEAAMRAEALYGDRVAQCFIERPRNLATMLADTVARHGMREAIVDEDRRLTYQSFNAEARAVAASLVASGVQPGDRVVVYMGNHCEYFVAVYAILLAGGVCVPVGTLQSAGELQYILENCGARGIFYDAEIGERLPDPATVGELKVKVSRGESTIAGSRTIERLAREGGTLPEATAGLERLEADLSFIMYTSGTTGRPKGVMLPHMAIYHMARHYDVTLGVNSADKSLMAVPATHMTGLVPVLMAMMQVGGCVVSRKRFKAIDTLETIASEGITITVLVPAMYNLCMREPTLSDFDLSRWRIAIYGGAAMPASVIASLAENIPHLALSNGYGGTETSSTSTFLPGEDTALAPTSIGRAMPGIDIKVMDDQGCEVATGQPGELWILGGGNATGYWANPDASRSGFFNGYWKSGDVGYQDERGLFYLLDRKKELVNRGGYKIYSVEIENALASLAGVIESAVVSRPCDVLGERTHVFIYADRPISEEEVRAHCRGLLADYKVLDFVSVSDKPLPRNQNGKVVKATLRQLSLSMA